MFSLQESLSYIRDVILMREPEEEMKRGRLDFLNNLIGAFYANMPFQNVTHIAKPYSERCVPPVSEIKQALLSRQGGLCCTSNLSLFMLLQSIGFDVHLNFTVCYPEENDKYDHVVLLVKNVEADGDLYLVEGGAGHPVFQAINLDFGDESNVYQESYLRYKFIKVGEKFRFMIDRSILYLSNDSSSKVPNSGKFVPFYEFAIRPTRDIEMIKKHMDGIYLHPEHTPFHNSIRAVKFRNKKLVLISNCKLVLEADDGSIDITILTEDEAIVAAFNEYFPEFGESCVRKAVQNWKKVTRNLTNSSNIF